MEPCPCPSRSGLLTCGNKEKVKFCCRCYSRCRKSFYFVNFPSINLDWRGNMGNGNECKLVRYICITESFARSDRWEGFLFTTALGPSTVLAKEREKSPNLVSISIATAKQTALQEYTAEELSFECHTSVFRPQALCLRNDLWLKVWLQVWRVMIFICWSVRGEECFKKYQ